MFLQIDRCITSPKHAEIRIGKRLKRKTTGKQILNLQTYDRKLPDCSGL